MRANGFVVVSVSGFLAVVGCSSQMPGSEGELGRSGQAIQGGQLDTTHKYAVGLCTGPAGSCFGSCSGTLILPNLVVTARHCVDDSPRLIDCSQNPTFGPQNEPLNRIFVTTNGQTAQGKGVGAGWYGVSQIIRPTVDEVCGNDIALLVLNKVVPGTEATPAIPGIQYSMGDARYAGRYTAIGYGITSPGGNDGGTRRILENTRIACIPNDPFIPCPAGVEPKEFVGGSGVCSGDSGSGAFEQKSFEAGKPVSFGVASRAGQDDQGTLCLQSVYTRLDAWRDLVVAAAATASNSWQLYPKPVPDWTVYVPPPVKDAGAVPPPPAPKAALGEACDVGGDCESGACIDGMDGGGVCSKDCVDGEAEACPDGFYCSGSLCIEGTQTASAPAKTTVKEGGCAAASGSADGGGLEALAALALVFGVRARRRRPHP